MWAPLESNPEVLNKYLRAAGAKKSKLSFVDVYGASPELLDMVPGSPRAVLFLYPISRASEKNINHLLESQEEEISAFMEMHPFFFTRQYVGNACGTIAMLHATLNNYEELGPVDEDTLLGRAHRKLFRGGKNIADEGDAADMLSPEDVGVTIAENNQLAELHAEAAAEGVTEAESLDTPIDLHFVCFLSVGGRCVELDGRKKHPLLHNACYTPKEFLAAAGKAMRERMEQDSESLRFSIIALVRQDDQIPS